jgi:hypothetical protein
MDLYILIILTVKYLHLKGPAIREARLKSVEDTINRHKTELNKVNEALKGFE